MAEWYSGIHIYKDQFKIAGGIYDSSFGNGARAGNYGEIYPAWSGVAGTVDPAEFGITSRGYPSKFPNTGSAGAKKSITVGTLPATGFPEGDWVLFTPPGLDIAFRGTADQAVRATVIDGTTESGYLAPNRLTADQRVGTATGGIHTAPDGRKYVRNLVTRTLADVSRRGNLWMDIIGTDQGQFNVGASTGVEASTAPNEDPETGIGEEMFFYLMPPGTTDLPQDSDPVLADEWLELALPTWTKIARTAPAAVNTWSTLRYQVYQGDGYQGNQAAYIINYYQYVKACADRGLHAWILVPPWASSQWLIDALASVKTILENNTWMKLYIEVGNEPWNFGFVYWSRMRDVGYDLNLGWSVYPVYWGQAYTAPPDTKFGLQFNSGGTAELVAPFRLKGATSGQFLTFTSLNLTGGSWAGGDAAGYFYTTSASMLQPEAGGGSYMQAGEQLDLVDSEGALITANVATAVTAVVMDVYSPGERLRSDAGIYVAKTTTPFGTRYDNATYFAQEQDPGVAAQRVYAHYMIERFAQATTALGAGVMPRVKMVANFQTGSTPTSADSWLSTMYNYKHIDLDIRWKNMMSTNGMISHAPYVGGEAVDLRSFADDADVDTMIHYIANALFPMADTVVTGLMSQKTSSYNQWLRDGLTPPEFGLYEGAGDTHLVPEKIAQVNGKAASHAGYDTMPTNHRLAYHLFHAKAYDPDGIDIGVGNVRRYMLEKLIAQHGGPMTAFHYIQGYALDNYDADYQYSTMADGWWGKRASYGLDDSPFNAPRDVDYMLSQEGLI